jgi:hypothetical protein
MLTYERSDSLEIVGYSNSNFAGYLDIDRSTSGYVFKVAGGAISWSSSKQTIMTSSTMCNIPATPDMAIVTSDSYLGS